MRRSVGSDTVEGRPLTSKHITLSFVPPRLCPCPQSCCNRSSVCTITFVAAPHLLVCVDTLTGRTEGRDRLDCHQQRIPDVIIFVSWSSVNSEKSPNSWIRQPIKIAGLPRRSSQNIITTVFPPTRKLDTNLNNARNNLSTLYSLTNNQNHNNVNESNLTNKRTQCCCCSCCSSFRSTPSVRGVPR